MDEFPVSGDSAAIVSALVANKDGASLFEAGMWKDYKHYSPDPLLKGLTPSIDVHYQKYSTVMEVMKPVGSGKPSEKVKVLLSFSGMTYERFADKPTLDLSLVTYKGKKPFSVDPATSTATYLVEVQRGVGFMISDSDFEWPKFTKTVTTDVRPPVNPGDPPLISITSTTTDRGRFSFESVHNEDVKVISPHGDSSILPKDNEPRICKIHEPSAKQILPYQHFCNTAIWDDNGLSINKFKAEPNLNFLWEITEYSHITNLGWSWMPGDDLNIGYGSNPTLSLRYLNMLNGFKDNLPPDNSFFGDKTIKVTLDKNNIAERKMRMFFQISAMRKLDDGTEVPTWYYYWKQGAVPDLKGFEYDPKSSALAEGGSWVYDPLTQTQHFYVTKGALEVTESVVVNGKYSEKSYGDGKGTGIHAVAKICRHETYHSILYFETLPVALGGLGLPDDDNDGLCNEREREIGTSTIDCDTFHLSEYTGGGANYSEYYSKGDRELYCRLKQNGALGVERLDWSSLGKQSYLKY